MKNYFYLALMLFAITSCKKEIGNEEERSGYIETVSTLLKDSLNTSDYSVLDFGNAVLSRVDSVQLYFLRIPFKGKSIANDFIIVKTTSEGKIEKGKIVHLEGKENEYGDGKTKRRKFDGSISISSLDRKKVLNSSINGGYITLFQSMQKLRELSADPIYPSDELPEVVVIAYVRKIEPISYSTWFLLNSFFYDTGDGGGGGSGNYYASLDGSSDYGGGGGGGYYGEGTDESYYGVANEPPILVDVDNYADRETIEIEQYLKCFDNVPDAGATCSVELLADIPVDTDPNKLFDFNIGSPGHTFIRISKANETQIVTQYLGFYPKNGWKTTLTNAPIAGKFVDDGGHEFNASIKKNLSVDEFKSVLTEILYLKNIDYDIDNYNCTDWALSVYNKQGTGLDIPLYNVPGNVAGVGTSTPQGVYNKLSEMFNNNDPQKGSIVIDMIKAWGGSGNGPCK